MTTEERIPDEYVWYGGSPSIDFVNTRRYRFEGGRELLQEPADLSRWLTAAELTPGRVEVDEALLAQAVQLREAIDLALIAVVAGDPLAAEQVAVVNTWLGRAAQYPPHLDLDQGLPVFRCSTVPADAFGALCRIAVDAAEMLGSEQRTRLRICAGINCSARFIDNSAGRRRRWCSMAGCGNRAKASQHRQAAAARAKADG
ncbi:CGNR zinc finger domain-containing protein [Kitasatospora kifunensis]|uniref:Putative RNA-binding Zn ribbon-like protein n=1 Tax=Kitasatospora kifunensis TaxID=58351 RepID=A0A7W7QYX4_KITKI|nr:ABATE domain-containing protein [Kitasatospora kifunensis]MBB4921656.1 putative RNA-binding Zn ribbon-like protein [Kitasatospora kifunensis]